MKNKTTFITILSKTAVATCTVIHLCSPSTKLPFYILHNQTIKNLTENFCVTVKIFLKKRTNLSKTRKVRSFKDGFIILLSTGILLPDYPCSLPVQIIPDLLLKFLPLLQSYSVQPLKFCSFPRQPVQ